MPEDRKETPEICPVCGADVPPGAIVCPDCGADHETGWNEEATRYDGLDIPDEDFNYDEYVKREYPDKSKRSKNLDWKWILGIIAGFGVIVVSVLLLVRGCHG